MPSSRGVLEALANSAGSSAPGQGELAALLDQPTRDGEAQEGAEDIVLVVLPHQRGEDGPLAARDAVAEQVEDCRCRAGNAGMNPVTAAWAPGRVRLVGDGGPPRSESRLWGTPGQAQLGGSASNGNGPARRHPSLSRPYNRVPPMDRSQGAKGTPFVTAPFAKSNCTAGARHASRPPTRAHSRHATGYYGRPAQRARPCHPAGGGRGSTARRAAGGPPPRR